MQAVILAAGRGKRLGELTRDKPKALINLLGRSLIDRSILTLKNGGIEEVIVVIGYLGEKIKKEIKEGEKKYGIRVKYVENEEWERGNGVSLLKVKKEVKNEFVVVMVDHLIDERIIKGIRKYRRKKEIVVGIDRKKGRKEDTKVVERGGRLINIGKDVKEFNGIDIGVFLCTPTIFSYLEESIKKGKEELSSAVLEAAKRDEVEVFDITGLSDYLPKMRKEVPVFWVDIDTKKDIQYARWLLVENASKNPSDLLAKYVHKPIENKLVPLLAQTKITPNQLSVLINFLAYYVTYLYITGHLLSGVILAFLVGILDGLDGKLARVKMMVTEVGVLEHSFDLMFEFSWLMGIGWWVYRSTGEVMGLVFAGSSIIFIAFYRSVYDRFGIIMRKSLDVTGKWESMFRRVAGRRNLYNIPILISVLMGAPLAGLKFILFHSGATALVYSLSAIKRMKKSEK